jgi:hypothetical protein
VGETDVGLERERGVPPDDVSEPVSEAVTMPDGDAPVVADGLGEALADAAHDETDTLAEQGVSDVDLVCDALLEREGDAEPVVDDDR